MSRDKGDDYGYWGDMRNDPPPKACLLCGTRPQQVGLHCSACFNDLLDEDIAAGRTFNDDAVKGL